MTGIDDREIAFVFDIQCAETLYLYEQEQEAKRFEALAGIGMMKQLTDEVQTITPADFRDQSW